MEYRRSRKARALMLFENIHGVSLGLFLASEKADMRHDLQAMAGHTRRQSVRLILCFRPFYAFFAEFCLIAIKETVEMQSW